MGESGKGSRGEIGSGSHTEPAGGAPVDHMSGAGRGSLDHGRPVGHHGRRFHAPSKLNFFRRHFCTGIKLSLFFSNHPTTKSQAPKPSAPCAVLY